MERSARIRRSCRYLSTLTVLSLSAWIVAGCTDDGRWSSGHPAADVPTAQDPGGSESDSGEGPAHDVCESPAGNPPVAVTVLDGGRDMDMISFDGTLIRLHWLPHPGAGPDDPRPTVLMGSGWGLSGATTIDDTHILGSASTRSLQDAGYNVMTWDPRGFGSSGGTAMIDSADFEGRDVQMMIDWLSTRPEVLMDAERDPRVAMIGGSYGGGIALVGAAVDCRVDAVVATAAWHSLDTSLYGSETIKIGWVEVLVRAAVGHSLDDHVGSAIDQALQTGVLSPEVREWFIDRGPGDLVEGITAPVLLIQSTVDTLFTLAEAVENHRRLSNNGVEVAMLWDCDGHGLCLTGHDDPLHSGAATIDWLSRHLDRRPTNDPGPAFETIDQNGMRYVSERYVEATDDYLSAKGEGRLELVERPPATAPVELASDPLLRQIAGDITPGPSTVALEVTLEADRSAMLVGAPLVQLRYRSDGPSKGTNSGPSRPARVFAQLVDETTGLLIGNQTTPVPLVLDGREHVVSIPLEIISHSVEPGSRITLQLVPTSVTYAVPLMGPTIEFDAVELRLPVADWLQRVVGTSKAN